MKKFTLVEIMGVIFIIVILISIGIGAYKRIQTKTAAVQIKAEIKVLQSTVDTYIQKENPYSSTPNNTVTLSLPYKYLRKTSSALNFLESDKTILKNIDREILGGTKTEEDKNSLMIRILDPYGAQYKINIMNGKATVTTTNLSRN